MATLSLTPEGTEPSPSPHDPATIGDTPVGKLGEKYVLLREIASGGMGRVYLAREASKDGMNRFVALKKIHDHLSSRSAFIHMFLDEARIASRIHHPNVCTVFDFGKVELPDQTGGAYFIAMEYLRGMPLSEVMRKLGTAAPEDSPERLTRGIFVLAQACEGLHAAHELADEDGASLNVVHRDVSPHNLFVGFDGTSRVLDFGVARAADRLSESTTGRVKGKLAYMAPEQALGKATDRRSDVFSLGVVLWELLTLRRLFKRDNPGETVLAVVQTDAEKPSKHARDISRELEKIALRALNRDPSRRFATAREMGRALTGTLAARGEVITAADVADWMDSLFPGQREASREMLRVADRVAETHAGMDASAVRLRSPPGLPLLGQLRANVEPPSRRSARWWIVPLVALFVGAALGLGAYGVLGSDRDAVARLPMEDPEVIAAAGEPPTPQRPRAPETAPTEETAPLEPPPAVPDRPVAETSDPPTLARRRPRRPRRPTIATRTARPTPSGTGRVRLSGARSLWGSTVRHRGRRLGVLPGTFELPVGAQTLTITDPHGARSTRSVEVRRGEVTRVVLR